MRPGVTPKTGLLALTVNICFNWNVMRRCLHGMEQRRRSLCAHCESDTATARMHDKRYPSEEVSTGNLPGYLESHNSIQDLIRTASSASRFLHRAQVILGFAL